MHSHPTTYLPSHSLPSHNWRAKRYLRSFFQIYLTPNNLVYLLNFPQRNCKIFHYLMYNMEFKTNRRYFSKLYAIRSRPSLNTATGAFKRKEITTAVDIITYFLNSWLMIKRYRWCSHEVIVKDIDCIKTVKALMKHDTLQLSVHWFCFPK